MQRAPIALALVLAACTRPRRRRPPQSIQRAAAGDAWDFNATNGFMITLDMNSHDVAAAGKAGGTN